MADPERNQGGAESTAELVKQLANQMTTLFRQEVELAKAEMAQKGKRFGVGAGMFGAAGLLGLTAFAVLTACFVLALAVVMPAALAALVVAVIYGAGAGILALQGKDRVKEAAPPVPEQTAESVKEDVEWLKTRARSAKR